MGNLNASPRQMDKSLGLQLIQDLRDVEPTVIHFFSQLTHLDFESHTPGRPQTPVSYKSDNVLCQSRWCLTIVFLP